MGKVESVVGKVESAVGKFVSAVDEAASAVIEVWPKDAVDGFGHKKDNINNTRSRHGDPITTQGQRGVQGVGAFGFLWL